MKISIIILLLLAGIIMSSCDPNELVVPEEPKEEEPVDKIFFTGPTGNLYSIKTDGTNQVRLFDKKEYQFIRFASLSPNGDKVVMNIWSSKTNISSNFILNVDNNEIKKIESEISIRNVVWSPDSERMLYSCSEKGLWITSVEDESFIMIGEGKVNRIIDGKSREVSNIYYSLNFLDNNRILFAHASYYFYLDGGINWINYGAYIINDDGSNKRTIVYNTEIIQNLILLSTTGKVIYQFFSLSNPEFSRTYILDLASEKRKELAINKHVNFLRSCPKGEKIAYVFFRDGGYNDIYVMNIANQTQQLIKTIDSYLNDLQFSYCGKKLVYSTWKEIYTINIDGTNNRKIAEGWMFHRGQ